MIDRSVVELRRALQIAQTRIEILVGRMESCHQITGRHELIGEAREFAKEAKTALVKFDLQNGGKHGHPNNRNS